MNTVFSSRLKALRKESGMSQGEVCKKIGAKQGAYSTWELGKNEPPLETFIQLANLFNVSTDWLLGRSDERSLGVSIQAGDGSAVAAQSPGANVAATAGGSLEAVLRLVEKFDAQQKEFEKLKAMVKEILPKQQEPQPPENDAQGNSQPVTPGPSTVTNPQEWRPPNW